MKSFSNFKSVIIFLITIESIFNALNSFAQNSETDAWQNYSKELQSKINRTKNVSIGIDFQLSNSYLVVSKTYVPITGFYASAIPSIKGFFPISQDFYIDFTVPYVLALKNSPVEGNLPGLEEYDFSHGMGDVNGGFNWQHFSKKKWIYSCSGRFMAPTGKSIFKDASTTAIPLGSGFWTIAIAGGLYKQLGKKNFISLDVSVASRMKTQFSENKTYSNDSINYATADPVFSGSFDIGIFGKQSDISNQFSLSFNEIYIGKTYTQHNTQPRLLFNNSFQIHRLGLKWVAFKNVHSVFTIFTGAQITEDISSDKSQLSFLIDFLIPVGFGKLGIKFY